jgi:hypothetical protein
VSDFDSTTTDSPRSARLADKVSPPIPAYVGNERAPVREGLPSGYRMRADAHYVDLLASRSSSARREQMLEPQSIDAPGLTESAVDAALLDSIRRQGIVQPLLVQHRNGKYRLIAGKRRLSAAIAAGMRTVPCLIHEIEDDEARQIGEASNVSQPAAAPQNIEPPSELPRRGGAELATSLETLTSCVNLLSGSMSGVSRAVITDLVGAEAWRASCLLQATRVVRREWSVTRSVAPVRTIVEQVVQNFAAERRLHLVDFDITVNESPGLVVGDPAALALAISSAVRIMVSVAEGTRGIRVAIGAAEEGGNVTFTISQSVAAAPERWVEHALDPAWMDRPGGATAAVLTAALLAIVEAHAGAVSVRAGAPGTSVVLTIPRR